MHGKSNCSAKYTRTFSNKDNDSAKVFLFEPGTNYPRSETARIRKILMLVGIMAIVCTIVAVIAIISSNSTSNEPSPKEGKLSELIKKPLAFFGTKINTDQNIY